MIVLTSFNLKTMSFEDDLALIAVESLLQAEANFLLHEKSDQRKLLFVLTKMAAAKKAWNAKQE